MKHSFRFMVLAIWTLFSASTCEKYDPDIYHDTDGNRVELIGRWGLTEVEYHTAGIVEKRQVSPTSLMEFIHGDRGKTLSKEDDGSWKEDGTFRYEVYRGSVTIFTEEEWENNRGLSDEDSAYERGRTYDFKVKDENTIYYREKVSEGSYLVNSLTRF